VGRAHKSVFSARLVTSVRSAAPLLTWWRSACPIRISWRVTSSQWARPAVVTCDRIDRARYRSMNASQNQKCRGSGRSRRTNRTTGATTVMASAPSTSRSRRRRARRTGAQSGGSQPTSAASSAGAPPRTWCTRSSVTPRDLGLACGYRHPPRGGRPDGPDT
jgi:hypothetical protein